MLLLNFFYRKVTWSYTRVTRVSFSALRKVVRLQRAVRNKTTDLAQQVWQATKREKRETQMAVRVLSKMLRNQKVTQQEKALLSAQSKDLVRILPLIALQGIPAPIPITPLLIALGKKYKIQILPADQTALMDAINQVPEEVIEQLEQDTGDAQQPETKKSSG